MSEHVGVLIRPATEADAAEISRVHVQSWRTTYRGIVPDEYLASLNAEERTERWRENICSGMHVLVATRQGDVIGFASGGAIRERIENYDAELYAIYLLEEVQRGGIGTLLRQELVRRLRDEGFQKLLVWVLQSNDAQGFYRHSGGHFVATGLIEIGGVPLVTFAYGWDIDSSTT